MGSEESWLTLRSGRVTTELAGVTICTLWDVKSLSICDQLKLPRVGSWSGDVKEVSNEEGTVVAYVNDVASNDGRWKPLVAGE